MRESAPSGFDMTYYDQVVEAAEHLRGSLGRLAPHVGIVLGSGLGAAAEAVTDAVVVPYGEIPHFPQSTVEGHSGRIVAGLLGESPVVILQGRVHFYEGYSPQQVTFPMRVLGALGVRAVVLTNAAGGIKEGYRVGQLVALSDHINLMGWNPLTGPAKRSALLRIRQHRRKGSRSKKESILPRRGRASRRRRRFAPFARWEPRW